jgi:hypothetical protein
VTILGFTLAPDTRSPGQRLYEADVAKRPNYHDGTPRPSWADLWDRPQSRYTWEDIAEDSNT